MLGKETEFNQYEKHTLTKIDTPSQFLSHMDQKIDSSFVSLPFSLTPNLYLSLSLPPSLSHSQPSSLYPSVHSSCALSMTFKFSFNFLLLSTPPPLAHFQIQRTKGTETNQPWHRGTFTMELPLSPTFPYSSNQVSVNYVEKLLPQQPSPCTLNLQLLSVSNIKTQAWQNQYGTRRKEE